MCTIIFLPVSFDSSVQIRSKQWWCSSASNRYFVNITCKGNRQGSHADDFLLKIFGPSDELLVENVVI